MNDEHVLSHWIKVQPDNYDEPTEVGLEVEVGIFISPYDIPDGVRGGYDKHRKRFVIEFRYMVDEAYHTRRAGEEPVWVRLGRHSSRIVGFEIDVDQLRASKVTVSMGTPQQIDPFGAVERAIQSVGTRRGARRRENYHVAQKVLEDTQDDLFRDLMHLSAD